MTSSVNINWIFELFIQLCDAVLEAIDTWAYNIDRDKLLVL